MAFNEKLARLAQDVIDELTMKKLTVVSSLDTNKDLYLTVTDTTPLGVNLLIKLVKEPQLGNNQVNPVTGLVEDVFTPHKIQLGFAALAAAKATATILGTIVVGDKISINGKDITSVNGPTFALEQFLLAGTPASATATILSTLAAGDKVSIRAIDFLSIDSGVPAANQWVVVGTYAATTITLAGVVSPDTVDIDGVTFNATPATQDATNFIVNASMIISATNLCTSINANPTTSAVLIADNAAGTSATITLTALAKGTAANSFGTVDGGSGHYTCANATLINGSINTTASAAALAAAINTSASPSIHNFVTASPAVAVVTVSSVAAGATGAAYTFTQTGGHITVTGAGFLVAGVIDTTATATNLAAAVNASQQAGILNIVYAGASAAVVTITADAPGTGGNAITFTQTGGHITVTGAGFLAGGSNTGTGPFPILYSFAACLPRGTQVEVFEKETSFAITDFVIGNLVAVFRNTQWGNIAHI